LNIPGNNFYGGLTEFIAGVQAGYNFQAGHFLFGVEGDFDWATFDHPTLPFPTLGSVSQHWIATAAARVGVVEDRWLVYGKLGGGWVHSAAEVNVHEIFPVLAEEAGMHAVIIEAGIIEIAKNRFIGCVLHCQFALRVLPKGCFCLMTAHAGFAANESRCFIFACGVGGRTMQKL
jgi:hypothetical protein